jgi:peptidoglycan hydrolase CwlO-like protein
MNYKTVFAIAFIILIFPFLGFPSVFEVSVNSILAIILIFMAVVSRLQKTGQKREVFEEHNPDHQADVGSKDISKEVDELEDEVDELEDEVEEIEEEVEDLEGEVNDLEEEVEDLKEDSKEIKGNLQSAQDLLDKLNKAQDDNKKED